MTVRLTTAQTDRAAGVLLGLACGDALGAPHEFRPPLPPETPLAMTGGGSFGWAPGEWTDDTSMAIPIARAAARGDDLREPAVLDGIVDAWVDWSLDATDVGNQTRRVLRGVSIGPGSAAEAAARAADDYAKHDGRGNGSLMRTAPVALAYLHDAESLVLAARAVSALTHAGDDSEEACVLWCLAIRHAVLRGSYDVRAGLAVLSPERAAVWASRLDEAEAVEPSALGSNGGVVKALMAAWSAVHRSDSYADAVRRAVLAGWDTDTVAAIAGGLAGARWGASAVPSAWRRVVHGWPGLRGRDLVELAVLAVRGGHPDSTGWPTIDRLGYAGWPRRSVLVAHPYDDGVLLGAIDDVESADVDAVVSLCRVGVDQLPAGVDAADRVEIWLIDSNDSAQNPNLELVLADAADAVAALRSEGKRVLLHCVQAQSRTPTVAALYAARHLGVGFEAALAAVREALPDAAPQSALVSAARAIAVTS